MACGKPSEPQYILLKLGQGELPLCRGGVESQYQSGSNGEKHQQKKPGAERREELNHRLPPRSRRALAVNAGADPVIRQKAGFTAISLPTPMEACSKIEWKRTSSLTWIESPPRRIGSDGHYQKIYHKSTRGRGRQDFEETERKNLGSAALSLIADHLFDGVRKGRKEDFKVLPDGARASWKIDDEGFLSNAGNTA